MVPVLTTHPLPDKNHPSSFGYKRKYDIHTGFDIYCDTNSIVTTIESGKIVNILKFTGPHAGSPWWNNTWAVMVEGDSGVLLYGEIHPYRWLSVNEPVAQNEPIGRIIQVLKKDKGVTPTSMLHMELYKHGTIEPVSWKHDEPQPQQLLDPTNILYESYLSRTSYEN